MFDSIINSIKNKFTEDFKIEKNCKWTILVNVLEGNLPSNLCSVEIFCLEDDKKTPIENLEFIWYREVENRSYQLNNNNPFYDFSGFDIGKSIKLSIKQKGSEEAAIITFNKTTLDFNLRFNLELIWSHNETTFQVNLNNNKDNHQDICSRIKIDKNNLIFSVEDKDLVFNLNEIGLESVYENYKKLIFYIDLERYDDETKKMIKNFLPLFEINDIYYCYLKFLNREFKDTFIISYKLINNINILNFSDIFKKLESINENGTIFEQNGSLSVAELLLDQDNLREVIKRMIKFNKNILIEKENVENYVENLELDLQYTIKEFKDIIIDLKKNKHIDKKLLDQSQNLLNEKSAKLNKKKLNYTTFNKNSKYRKKEDSNKINEEIKNLKKINGILLKEIKKYKNDEVNRKEDNSFNLSKFENENKALLKDVSQISIKSQNKMSFNNILNNDLDGLENENSQLKKQILELKNELNKYDNNNGDNNQYKEKLKILEDNYKDLRNTFNMIINNKLDLENIQINEHLSKDIKIALNKANDKHKIEILNIENNGLNKQLDQLKKENLILRKNIKDKKNIIENSINQTMIKQDKNNENNDHNSLIMNSKNQDFKFLKIIEKNLKEEKLKNAELNNIISNLKNNNKEIIEKEEKINELMKINEELNKKLNIN